MRIGGAGVLLIAAGCGGVIATNDSDADAGSIANTGNGKSGASSDAGSQPSPAVIGGPNGISPMTIPASPFVPIDTTDWLDVDKSSTCSFQITVNGAATSVVGSKVVAFIAGTEVPYLVFGCTGNADDISVSFLAGTVSGYGENEGQWATIDIGDTTVSVDDAHIAGCDLEEWSTSFGTIGTEVTGSFACNVVSEQIGPLQIANGYYDTVLTSRTARDLP